ncbi:unnamed protein product [Arabis nemorensis]|uniref:Uncharacterized protein n=1 Tax=Arabis nemorensis TaxID=586526 RepID=A0A565CMN9_9BRAS|nr:unnamed protein product [Arabis nemorensis]
MDRGDAVNSGTIDEGGANSLAIIAQNEHEVVYRFTGIVGWGEVGNLLDDDAEPVFDDMAGLGEIDADDEMWLSEENLYVGRYVDSID